MSEDRYFNKCSINLVCLTDDYESIEYFNKIDWKSKNINYIEIESGLPKSLQKVFSFFYNDLRKKAYEFFGKIADEEEAEESKDEETEED